MTVATEVRRSIIDHEWKTWGQIDPELRKKCVDELQTNMAPEFFAFIKHSIEIYGDRWMDKLGDKELYPLYSFHMYQGMTIRNLLRNIVKDDELPSSTFYSEPIGGNWDDCYVPAIEIACGAKEDV